MDKNVTGFILSYVLVFVVIAVATLLIRLKLISGDTARKLVHIGVSNWWILAMCFFDNPWYPCAGALSFIIINYISYRKHLFTAMEAAQHRDNLGTVYFPVSLLVLSYACFSGIMPLHAGAAGVLIMGYGDGFAALAGTHLGRHEYRIFGNIKSIEGSAVMFAVSFLVVYIIMSLYHPESRLAASAAIAALAAAVEGFTPYGLDNITVPIISSFCYFYVFIQ